jgi:hypothetical protein
VLFIYRIQSMPDPLRTLRRWRELWRAGGIDDVQIVKFDTHGDSTDPGTYGADSAAQFLPHGTNDAVPRRRVAGAHEGNVVFAYDEVAQHYMDAEQPSWRHECVLPGWDNSPRRGDGRSMLLHGSTPELYEEWLATVYERAPRDGLVLINAWNEWAEGAHLEPDLRHGDAYLKATGRALGAAIPTEVQAPPSPLAAVPFELRDRFAELYLDGLATQTVLQRRLSRLEATLERQLAVARMEAEAEAAELRAHAATLLADNDRLRLELATSAEQAC